jgi:hypothetical protein
MQTHVLLQWTDGALESFQVEKTTPRWRHAVKHHTGEERAQKHRSIDIIRPTDREKKATLAQLGKDAIAKSKLRDVHGNVSQKHTDTDQQGGFVAPAQNMRLPIFGIETAQE